MSHAVTLSAESGVVRFGGGTATVTVGVPPGGVGAGGIAPTEVAVDVGAHAPRPLTPDLRDLLKARRELTSNERELLLLLASLLPGVLGDVDLSTAEAASVAVAFYLVTAWLLRRVPPRSG